VSDVIRVFLVDDHELVRRGIASFLGSATDLLIVGEAATAAQALARVPAVRPDVVLLDVRLPDGSGIDVCRELRVRSPDVPCIILTAYDDDDAVLASVVAGAAGYIRKDIAGSALVDGIRTAAAGRSLLDAALVAHVGRHLRDAERGDPRLAGLSRREAEVLALIADGQTNREIASTLSLAEKTVKNYVSSLLSKLGLHTRTQAAVLRTVTDSGPARRHPDHRP
jgi:two-component system, NarL family, response regulator DevR